MSIWTDLTVPFRVERVDVNGIGTRALVAGDGEDVLFLHGTSGHLEAFTRNIVPHVEAGFRCHAIDLLDWGGQCILLGVPKLGTEASFVVNTLYNDKSIMGCRYGSTRPHHDIPMYVQFYLDGRMPLGEMVSQTYDLADVSQALDDLHAGKLNRGVLRL